MRSRRGRRETRGEDSIEFGDGMGEMFGTWILGE